MGMGMGTGMGEPVCLLNPDQGCKRSSHPAQARAGKSVPAMGCAPMHARRPRAARGSSSLACPPRSRKATHSAACSWSCAILAS